VKLYNLNGDYDKAIDLLKNHHFRTWEGGREIYYHYVDAHTLKATELANAGKNNDAISELKKAMEYPENLEVGKPLNDERNAMLYYYMGKNYEEIGNGQKANDCFRKSVNAKNSRSWPDLLYYQGKSYERLKDLNKANAMYQALIDAGNSRLEKGSGRSGIGVEEGSSKNDKSISDAYYLIALGNLGLKRPTDAKKFFQEALNAYKNNLWATTHMRSVVKYEK
jgi:hypothetical protein